MSSRRHHHHQQDYEHHHYHPPDRYQHYFFYFQIVINKLKIKGAFMDILLFLSDFQTDSSGRRFVTGSINPTDDNNKSLPFDESSIVYSSSNDLVGQIVPNPTDLKKFNIYFSGVGVAVYQAKAFANTQPGQPVKELTDSIRLTVVDDSEDTHLNFHLDVQGHDPAQVTTTQAPTTVAPDTTTQAPTTTLAADTTTAAQETTTQAQDTTTAAPETTTTTEPIISTTTTELPNSTTTAAV